MDAFPVIIIFFGVAPGAEQGNLLPCRISAGVPGRVYGVGSVTGLTIRRRSVPFSNSLAVHAELEALYPRGALVAGKVTDDAVHRRNLAVGITDDIEVAGSAGKLAVNRAFVMFPVDIGRHSLPAMT